MTLIEHYQVTRIPGGCSDDPSSVSIQATLPAGVSAVFPTINALLPGCAYNPGGQVVTWSEGRHRIVLRPAGLAISNLATWAEACEAMERLVGWLNETWQRRDALPRRDEPHPQPAPLAVYRELPNTNCRACGHPTCFTFALKLVAREARPADCPDLSAAEWAAQRARLEGMLLATPRVVFTQNGEET
jgi:ArsR family metal-binding transcriptional regulator